jgi:hypothetical protein
MEGGAKLALRQEIAVQASQPETNDIDKQPRSAFAAKESRVPLQGPCLWGAAYDCQRVCGINGLRDIGRTVNGLAIVAMAIELNERFSAQFNLHLPAAALNACGRHFPQLLSIIGKIYLVHSAPSGIVRAGRDPWSIPMRSAP